MTTPQSARALAATFRASRAHTYASENADLYRGFDNGQFRAAEALEAWCDAWEKEIRAAQKQSTGDSIGPLYSMGIATAQDQILKDIIGPKEHPFSQGQV